MTKILTAIILSTAVAFTPIQADEAKPSNKKDYDLFWTYPYSPNQAQKEAEAGGILTIIDGCLFLTDESKTLYELPVFPEGVTSWDDETQTLTIKNKKLPLGKSFLTNGWFSEYDPKKIHKYKETLDPKCFSILENMDKPDDATVEIVGIDTQFMSDKQMKRK